MKLFYFFWNIYLSIDDSPVFELFLSWFGGGVSDTVWKEWLPALQISYVFKDNFGSNGESSRCEAGILIFTAGIMCNCQRIFEEKIIYVCIHSEKM